MRVPAHPGLYGVERDVPTLNGTRCSACGRVYFPPLAIGCEVCGATEEHLEPTTLVARGVLHSLAPVHLHFGHPPTPFTVVEVQLGDGPLIRATAAPDAGDLEIGDDVAAVWVVTKVDGQGDETVEPMFVKAAP